MTHRTPIGRRIQLFLVLGTVAWCAALFGAVEIRPQTVLVTVGAILLVWNLLGGEADAEATGRGRNAGPRWLLLAAAVVGLVALQLVPVPPLVRRLLSPGGYRLEQAVLPAGHGAVADWQDLFPDRDGGAQAPESTAELWQELDKGNGQGSAAAIAAPAPRKVVVPASPGASSQWRAASVVPGATRASLSLLIAYLGIFFATVHVSRDERLAVWVLDGLLVIAFLVSIAGLIQEASGVKAYYGIREFGLGANPYGPFANRNHFAAFVGALFPVAALRTLHRVRQARERHAGDLRVENRFNSWALAILWGFFVVVIGVGLVRCLSRGGLLTVLAGTLVGALLLGAHRPRKKELSVAAIVIIVAAAAAFPLLKGRTDDIRDRSEESIAEASAGRLALTKAALRHWLDFPVLGSGLGSYPWTSGIRKPPTGENAMERAHDDYVEWIAETGVAGALLLVAGLVLFGRELSRALAGARRRHRFLLAGVAGGIFSVLLHELGDFNLQVPAVAVLTAALAGLAVGVGHSGYRARSGRGQAEAGARGAA